VVEVRLGVEKVFQQTLADIEESTTFAVPLGKGIPDESA
jgi:hypothetical protein